MILPYSIHRIFLSSIASFLLKDLWEEIGSSPLSLDPFFI